MTGFPVPAWLVGCGNMAGAMVAGWRFLGQLVAYSMLIVMPITAVAMRAESLSVSAIVISQETGWNIVTQPLGLALFWLAAMAASFLPPFERWYSGLLPYSLLLPAQIALNVLMLKIVADFARRDGYFVRLKPRTGVVLQVLAGIYALFMVVRYVLTMALHPELRWFTGTIPIWFHFVLAAFIFTLGRYALRHNSPSGPMP